MPEIFTSLKSLLKPRKIGAVLLLFILLLISLSIEFKKQNQTEQINSSPTVTPTSTPTPTPLALVAPKSPPPDLTARSVVVIDLATEKVVYAKNPQARLSPASTTKIMTALIAQEVYDLNQVLTVKTAITDGRIMGLRSGEQMTVENLLYGTLVHSANDAAYVLAENYPEGFDEFINLMNLQARKLNMNNTHFTNPIGFDNENHYSSSMDLARLAIYALSASDFLRFLNARQLTVTDVTGKISHPLANVNQLVGQVQGVYGFKTGWTENAGECLVAVTERNGQKILTVVLGSKDRFGETKKLIDWAFSGTTLSPTAKK